MGAAITPATTEAYLLTGAEAVALIREDKLSITEYAQSLLDRIGQRDADVRAWAHLDRYRVLAEARRLDAIPRNKRGPLHGMPIAVKDVICTKDMPTQFNSPAYKGQNLNVDAGSILVLRSAGALLLGKTTTTEFASTDFGHGTNNPHDLSRTPGGSSAGSGAAVGDFQAPVALGTQTGGSTIRPASYNGIYGFKPTWGAITREFQKFFSITYDTLGFFTRGVDDISLLCDAFDIKDDQISTFSGLSGARFAVLRTMMWPAAEDGTRKALDRGIELLKAHGATVEDVELPAEFDQLSEWYNIVLDREGATAFYPEYCAHRSALAPLLVDFVHNTKGYTHRQYTDALDKMAALRPKIDELMSKYTAVLTPSATDEAPVGLSTGSYAFCKIWTALHVPVLNIPGFQGANGMPIGLSLISGRYQDRHLLAVSEVVGPIFEQEGGWSRPVHRAVTTHQNGTKVVAKHSNGSTIQGHNSQHVETSVA